MFKKNYPFILVAFVCAAISISSCKKEDQMSTPDTTSSNTVDMTEGGANPDEAALAGNTNERFGRGGYLYTESNETAQNEILCYRQHGDGSLTLENTVASGGTGVGAG